MPNLLGVLNTIDAPPLPNKGKYTGVLHRVAILPSLSTSSLTSFFLLFHKRSPEDG